MEALGGAASVVSILQEAGAIVERGFWLFQQIQDAPAELAAAQGCLVFVRAELSTMSGLVVDGSELGLDMAAMQSATDALTAAERALNAVHADLNALPSKLRVRGRVKWALLDQRRSERIQRHLKSTESSPMMVLVLLIMRNQNVNFARMKAMLEFKASVTQPLLPTSQGAVPEPCPAIIVAYVVCNRGEAPLLVKLFVDHTLVGLHAIIMRIKWSDDTHWYLALQQYIPCTFLFGGIMFQFRLRLCSNALGRGINIRGGSGLAFAKVVEEDSPLMEACRTGQIEEVRRILATRGGLLTDVTPAKWGAMPYAIQSGNIELVRLLVKLGVGLDWTFGNNHTSPVQFALWTGKIEIARFLLQKGADAEYRNATGYSMAYYAWASRTCNVDVELVFEMLKREGALGELNSLDSFGLSCLHHVSSHGTAKEMETLLRMGADPWARSEGLAWNAFQYSVYDNNQEAFSVLMSRRGNQISYCVDDRGWILLHMAAATGNRALILDLLGRGADANARTGRAGQYVDDSLLQKECLPADIAACRGPEVLAIFREAVESHYASLGLTASHAEDGQVDIFYDL